MVKPPFLALPHPMHATVSNLMHHLADKLHSFTFAQSHITHPCTHTQVHVNMQPKYDMTLLELSTMIHARKQGPVSDRRGNAVHELRSEGRF